MKMDPRQALLEIPTWLFAFQNVDYLSLKESEEAS